jgi:flagellar motor switch/type III secretory pathway protein FliN
MKVPEATAQHTESELITVNTPPAIIGDPLQQANMLPCRLVLETPVVSFTVGTLMELEPGAIVETAAQHNEDLLLHVNGQLVGTVKFDVTRDQLAVRVTGVA